MHITSNLNGNTKITSYGNKLFFRESENDEYTQIKRGFYRESENDEYVQIYLYDEVAPTIVITSSLDDTIIKSYDLEGTITDTESGNASVLINSVDYPIISGVNIVDVQKNFNLEEGNNDFTIVATDIAGNVAQKTVTVKYINQKDNPSYNWSNRVSSGNNTYVVINGTRYQTYQSVRNSQEEPPYSFISAWASASSNIPLPKGISSAYFYGGCGGEAGTGYTSSGDLSMRIYDATTGQNIASNSRNTPGTLSLSASISEEQAKHDLRLIYSSSGFGTQYSSCSAWAGVSSWSFNYYQ